MKHLLLPIDGSRRSRHTLEIVKLLYTPETTRLTVLLVVPNTPADSRRETQRGKEAHRLRQEAPQILADLCCQLPGYQVDTVLRHGEPGPEIVRQAREGIYDAILMTRSRRKLGSVAAYVIKTADDQNVFVMHERQ